MRYLSDSALFNQIILNNKLKESLKVLNYNNDGVPQEMISDVINNIDKKFNNSTKSFVLEDYKNGFIKVIRNEENPLPRYLNTFGRMGNGKIEILVDVTNYSRKDVKNNELVIFPSHLFSLLQGGSILYRLYTNWEKYTYNMNLIKSASLSYVYLVNKIFDKLYAVNIDPVKSDLINFIFAKFFLINHCDYKNLETINNIAYSCKFNETSLEYLLNSEERIMTETEGYRDFFKLFECLKNIEGMSSLKIRTFLDNWMRMYGEGTILALDYLPSFIAVLSSSSIGANIHKDYIIENTCGKYSSKVVLEFSKLSR